jgi:hypothetical protein
MEVTMRLGKEQAAGYVEDTAYVNDTVYDTEPDVTKQVPAPAAAVAADSLPVAEQEPATLPR